MQIVSKNSTKMTHTYQVTGMTCGGCEATVKSNLMMLPDVTSVAVSKDTNTANGFIGISPYSIV